MADEQPAPAQWYPDPNDSAQLRYWDGSQWTDKTKAAGRERPHGPTNRLAVTAFVCAIAVPFGGPLLAIVLGLLALDEIEDSHGAQRGKALAQWAIGLGVAVMLITIYVVFRIVRALD